MDVTVPGTHDAFSTSRSWQHRRWFTHHWDVLGVIAFGGALGTLARYGLGLTIPFRTDGFPWSTLVVNVSGCLAIGAFMAAITEMFTAHRLLRPFLGIGVLGGYTTFSSYVIDTIRLAHAGHYRAAVGYSMATLFGSLIAVLAGSSGIRSISRKART